MSTSLDTACRELAALCQELGIWGAHVGVRCDGRVEVELLRDSVGSVREHADITHPENPLPAPSRALTMVTEKMREQLTKRRR
jgi:hypothetical protein